LIFCINLFSSLLYSKFDKAVKKGYGKINIKTYALDKKLYKLALVNFSKKNSQTTSLSNIN